MNPGSRVASPRSMTCAPAGTDAPEPTAVILLSVMTMRPGVVSELLFPSNIRAALSTIVLLGVCWGCCAFAASGIEIDARVAAKSAATGQLRVMNFLREKPAETIAWRREKSRFEWI